MTGNEVINKYSSLALAYIGDAHYALVVKEFVINKEEKIDRIQKLTNRYVSAKAQAAIMAELLNSDILTEEEIEVYKRGRNAHMHRPPKNTDVVTYHMSTGFEALWGYLYLVENGGKLEQIWNKIRTFIGD